MDAVDRGAAARASLSADSAETGSSAKQSPPRLIKTGT